MVTIFNQIHGAVDQAELVDQSRKLPAQAGGKLNGKVRRSGYVVVPPIDRGSATCALRIYAAGEDLASDFARNGFAAKSIALLKKIERVDLFPLVVE